MALRRLQFGIYLGGSYSKNKEPWGELQNNIINLFSFYLPKMEIEKVQKINIDFFVEPDKFFIIPQDLNSNIITIRETFNFEAFEPLTDDEKKIFLFERVYNCLRVIFEKLQIDDAILKLAHDTIIEKNFELTLTLCGGPKLNRKKGLTAKVIAEYFVDNVLISVFFTGNDDKPLAKINLFKTLPHHLFYMHLIKISRWLDSETFEVSNPTKEINIKVNTGGKVLIDYKPIGRDIDGIKEEIRYYTQELFFEL
jgi:hypothetical protein